MSNPSAVNVQRFKQSAVLVHYAAGSWNKFGEYERGAATETTIAVGVEKIRRERDLHEAGWRVREIITLVTPTEVVIEDRIRFGAEYLVTAVTEYPGLHYEVEAVRGSVSQ